MNSHPLADAVVRSAAGRTRSFRPDLHALDLANRVRATVPIVVAAPGVFAYVFRDAGEDPHGGSGYGNQVRVLHDGGLLTEHAHLDRAEVEVGDAVHAGQRLGTVGRSGLARDRHLRFGLHRGISDGAACPPTMELTGLVTQEIGDGFVRRPSGELRCSPEGKPGLGALHASDNDGGETVLGPAPPRSPRWSTLRPSELGRSVQRRGAIALRRRPPGLAERAFACAAALLPRAAGLDFAERQRALAAGRP